MNRRNLLQRIWQVLFLQESGIRKYFRNTSWLLGARIFQMLVALVIGGLVARYLGPEKYGTYNYVISFVAIFSALSTMGIATVVVKDMVAEETDYQTAMGTGFMLKLAGSSLAFLLVLACTFFVEDAEAVRMLLLIAGLQTIIKSTEIINSYFQARVESRKAVRAQMISLILISALRLYGIAEEKELSWFLWMLPLDALVIGGIMLWYMRNIGLGVYTWHSSFSYGKRLLSESWPSLFSGIFVTIYMKIDQVMLQELLNAEEVGYYAAAVRLSEVWITVPWIISGSLFPAMVNAAKESEQAFHTRINQAYILLISMALLVALPVTFLSKPVIHLIFGQVYDPSVGVLQIHIFSCLFIFLGSVSNRWLVIRKQQRYWMINSGLGALANILLNLWMIPKWGIQGAAWATLISYAFAYYFAYALFPRTRHIFSSQSANFFRVLTILPAWREIKKLQQRL
ncbi:MAG: flippase [Chitinophagales bacterium]|nr:flippase [Bacteroidota bacterium]HQU38798.1 flippase [Chitinophagales bacterium]HQU77012.1 flippase [Chitinophagales bacterium]